MANPQRNRSSQLRVIAAGLTSLLILACGVQWATGQAAVTYYEATYDPSLMTTDPKTNEVKVNDKAVKAAAFIKNQVLIGSLPYADNADKFKYYYANYFFKSLTRSENIHTLPEKRKELADDLRRAKAKDVHDQLRADTFNMMKKLVPHAQIHPAVRFNAMLIIGDLNADEAGIAFRFPNPLPEALDYMLEQYQNPTQLEAVKLAAMIGMLRHEQLNWSQQNPARIPPAKQQKIVDLMLALINQKEPPPGRLKDGHVWMQRRAVEILAATRQIGTNDAVTQAVTGLVRDHAADLTLRCTAAEALGKTAPVVATTKSKITDPTKESLQLAALLVEACHSELDRMEVWHKKMMGIDPSAGFGGEGGKGMMSGAGMSGGMMGGMMGGMTGGMMGGMMGGADSGGLASGGMTDSGGAMGMAIGGPKDPLVELFRRQIKYEIDCVRKGLGGVGRLAPAEKGKQPFPEIHKEIDAVWKITDPPYASTLPVLHKSLKDSLKKLEDKTVTLRPKKPLTEEEAEEASDAPPSAPAALGAPAARAAGNPPLPPPVAPIAESDAPEAVSKTAPAPAPAAAAGKTARPVAPAAGKTAPPVAGAPAAKAAAPGSAPQPGPPPGP